MNEHILTTEHLTAFLQSLRAEERAAATIDKYQQAVYTFFIWLDGRAVTKENVIAWKEYLLSMKQAASTVNAKLSALNGLFRFLGWDECRVRFLRVQHQIFRAQEKELTKDDYQRLLDTARLQSRGRLALLMESICSTGIRVSETRYITVEAAKRGQAVIRLKGKIRTILLPDKLCQKLLKYAETQKIASGEIFLTRSGKGLSRGQIWAEMKSLCEAANVEPSKVFPHNLRHLFATAFYQLCHDIVKLADVLGHSSIETTRIYLRTTGAEHRRYLDQLCLIS